MDHLVDKELAGWSYSKSCGQWLNVHMETGDEWCSSGLGIGTGLFHTFIGDVGSGTAPSADLPTTPS